MENAIRWNVGITIRDLLDRNRDVAPGFHFLRYALATTIFAFHAYYVIKGQVGAVGYNDLIDGGSIKAAPIAIYPWSATELLRPWLFSLVAAFFAVSGFLVTGSAQRLKSVKIFLGFRVLRIVPALAVETLLSALILGPLLSTEPISSYFSDPLFFRYFGNIVGHISMLLPGVFEDNPVRHIVNVNLWTLPGEFYCYAIMAAAMALGLAYSRRGWVIIAILGTICFMAAIAASYAATRANTTHFTTPMIVYYFFVGCLFYQFSSVIKLRFLYFALSALAYYLITKFSIGDLLAPAFLTYCAIFVGCQAYPFFDRVIPGDYSYGIYLYGFPIQQSVVALLPSHRNYFVVICISAIVTIIFAVLSWNFIEKPALKLKKWVIGTKGRVQQSQTVIGVATVDHSLQSDPKESSR